MTHQRGLSVLEGGLKTGDRLLEVLDGGMETTVQDYWGREGYLQLGIPRSGPMDCQSFALGNQILGNDQNAAGLEIQFIGPKLKFFTQTTIAITGADNAPKINQKSVPLWTPLSVQPGDLLSFGHAEVGSRSYLTVARGIEVPVVMGSRSTFVKATLGGLQGRKLQPGDLLYACASAQSNSRSGYLELHVTLHPGLYSGLPTELIPEFTHHWEVEVIAGPHEDCLTAGDIRQFLDCDWIVSSKSDRVGYRLEGPAFQFATHPYHKPPDNGGHPSNKIDYGCSLGAVLFCGQTPTILMVDGPSLTGYMAPFTVVETSLRKVGQARPGDKIRFKLITLEVAIQKLHTLRY